MRKGLIALGVVCVLLLSACRLGSSPEPTPTNTPLPTATPPPTHTPRPTATPAPTYTPEAKVAPGYDFAAEFAGAWEGEWTNLTFGSSGSAEAIVTVHEDGTLNVTVDLGGSVFGMGDPNPLTFLGTYDERGANVGVEGHPIFGTFQLALEGDSLSVEAENIPVEQISGMDVAGTLTPDRLDAQYVISFPDGTSAQGTLKMTHIE